MSWSNFSLWGMGSSFQNYFYGPDIKLYGLKAFDCFLKNWEFDDFWKRATTCDACLKLIDPLFTENPNAPEIKEMCKILEKNLIYFTGTKQDDKWIDDFGWWGLLGVNAYEFLMKVGDYDLAQAYLKLSKECFDIMINVGYDVTKGIKPVENGCRNTTILLQNEGVKNSVVNALLLLLSTKLYRLNMEKNFGDQDRFLKMAYQQWTWFSKWFDLSEYQYLKTFKGNVDAALIGERPLAFFDDSNYQTTNHPDWAPNWIWSGDNGLLLGGLLDLIAVKDHLSASVSEFNAEIFNKKINFAVNKLIQGIQKGMIGKDGIFHEPPCLSSYATNGKDYFVGRGILVRYMNIKEIKAFSGVDFSGNILKTVDALWKTREENTNQFKAEFTTKEANLDYANQFDELWGFSDQAVQWVIDADEKTKNAICQAVGLDFLAAALTL